MFAIVKFENKSDVAVFNISNSGYAHDLLTMDGVEWIQVITSSGYLCVPDEKDRTRLSLMDHVGPMRPIA
jgi:hypothetical protein